MADDPFDSLGVVLSTFLGSSGAAIADQLEIAYDKGVISDIVKVLEDAQTQLKKSENIRQTHAAAYGSSPAGQALAYNASLAREKVIEVIGDMRSGLMGYQEVVTTFHSEAEGADDSNAGDMTTLKSAMDCVNAPTVGAPSQCTLPTGGDH